MSLRSLFILPAFFISSLMGAEKAIPLIKFKSTDDSVSATLGDHGELAMQIAANAKGYPGAGILPPEGAFFDLSAYSRVEAIIRNTGDQPIQVMVRVDNPGHWKDEPFSTESVHLGPGDTGTVVVFFGFRHGFQKGFALDPSKVRQILVFTKGSQHARDFVVESITASGSQGETPQAWQNSSSIAPERGILLGSERPLESARQLRALSGAIAKTSEAKDQLQMVFSGAGQQVQFSPTIGRWNLRDATQLEVEIANTGQSTVQPGALLKSRSGSTGISSASIAPGESSVLQVPFAPQTPWTPGDDDGDGFDSYRVDYVSILSGQKSAEQTFEIRSIRATSPTVELPDWLGKRPPVEGDWNLTFREEFDSPQVDEQKWNVYTENHWDKKAHFSKENVIIEDGLAKLRFEKKTGRHNDQPDGKETEWQTGFLDTYDKWTQLYGYFEARMKLPTAPGLWPAFWAMPDRGAQDGPKWKRSQTSRGGMEFDIMEHLSRWGPHRYNVAFHWDGYGKGHKHDGTSEIYVQHDGDGFITAGWLWLPGKCVYYCNGKKVGRWESDRISNVPSILMFTHVSGGWDNDALDPSTLPDDFIIDYVRVWQRRDLQ